MLMTGKTIYEYVKEQGLETDSLLNDLVNEECNKLAAIANERGFHEQVRFLKKVSGLTDKDIIHWLDTD